MILGTSTERERETPTHPQREMEKDRDRKRKRETEASTQADCSQRGSKQKKTDTEKGRQAGSNIMYLWTEDPYTRAQK